ncbi:YeeE/YedE thiosulfate transporter family protein [Mycolicibacterium fallax]|uniref:Uncharacterized protein n=1 Tax=Mycolicibacterium fallax TaxID=1793 RepID=A0A1X1R7E5_MYCFA|nr:YeeE/YedE thiosulfate transporter family protein [Mycolicibacterium fallax]ORV00810.1 hypothetical protein AWC04_15485 [Mycolicibacterium fallax]BBY97222.1 hypothetical protein MFAL_06890 [Mycolicibacterium fallax]
MHVSVTAPLWVGLLVGLGFGLPAAHWGIGNPETVIRTARLLDRLIIGCFAAVTAMGAVLLYGLHALGFAMHFGPKPLYLWGVLLGGLLFGVGVAISGYFPGTEWIALGEGRRDALYAIPGAILGAAAWTLVYQTPAGRWLTEAANFGDLILTGDIAALRPGLTFAVAVGYAALMFGALFYLPRYSGGNSSSCLRHLRRCSLEDGDRARAADTAAALREGTVDLVHDDAPKPDDGPATNDFYARRILVTAAAVATLVVAAIFLRQIFGQSTSYSWLVGKLALPGFDYTAVVTRGIGWEPLTDVGVMFGGLVAAVLIGRRFSGFRRVLPPSWRNRFGPSTGRRAAAAFGGSFLVLFGARMAGGCASGHILSGGVQLALSGWVFTAAVLIAMVVTARLVYRDADWRTVPDGVPAPRPVAGRRFSALPLAGVAVVALAAMAGVTAWLTAGAATLSLAAVLAPLAIVLALVAAATVAARS